VTHEILGGDVGGRTDYSSISTSGVYAQDSYWYGSRHDANEHSPNVVGQSVDISAASFGNITCPQFVSENNLFIWDPCNHAVKTLNLTTNQVTMIVDLKDLNNDNNTYWYALIGSIGIKDNVLLFGPGSGSTDEIVFSTDIASLGFGTAFPQGGPQDIVVRTDNTISLGETKLVTNDNTLTIEAKTEKTVINHPYFGDKSNHSGTGRAWRYFMGAVAAIYGDVVSPFNPTYGIGTANEGSYLKIHPSGPITVDNESNLYVLDYVHEVIWKVPPKIPGGEGAVNSNNHGTIEKEVVAHFAQGLGGVIDQGWAPNQDNIFIPFNGNMPSVPWVSTMLGQSANASHATAPNPGQNNHSYGTSRWFEIAWDGAPYNESSYFCGPGNTAMRDASKPSVLWNPNHHRDCIQDIIVSKYDNKLYIVMKRNKIYKLDGGAITELPGFTNSIYVGLLGSIPLHRQSLHGITFDSNNNIYAVITEHPDHGRYTSDSVPMTTSAWEIDAIKIIKIDGNGNQTLYANVDSAIFNYLPERTRGNVAPDWGLTKNGSPVSTAKVSQLWRKPQGITMDSNNNIYVSVGPMLVKVDTLGKTQIVVNDNGDIDELISKVKYDPVTDSIFYQMVNSVWIGTQSQRSTWMPRHGGVMKYHIKSGLRDKYYGFFKGYGYTTHDYVSLTNDTQQMPGNYIAAGGNFYNGGILAKYYQFDGTSEHPSMDFTKSGGNSFNNWGQAGSNLYGLAIDNSGYIFSTFTNWANYTASGSVGGFGLMARTGSDGAHAGLDSSIHGYVGSGVCGILMFTRDVLAVENTPASSTVVTDMRLTVPGNEVTINNVTTTTPDKDLIKFTSSSNDSVDTSLLGDINFGHDSKSAMSIINSNESYSAPWPMIESGTFTFGGLASGLVNFQGDMAVGQWKNFVSPPGNNTYFSAIAFGYDEDTHEIWSINNSSIFSHINNKGQVYYYLRPKSEHADYAAITTFFSKNNVNNLKPVGDYIYMWDDYNRTVGSAHNSYDFTSTWAHPRGSSILRVNKHDLKGAIDPNNLVSGYPSSVSNTIGHDIFEEEWRTHTVYNGNTNYYHRIKTVKFISNNEAIIFLGTGGHDSTETTVGNEHLKVIKFNFDSKAVTTLVDSVNNNSGYQKLTNAGWTIGSGIYNINGYHVDDDNNIYIPNLDVTSKMLYKLETDSNVTTISSASAYWDTTGLLTWGAPTQDLIGDRNTIFTATVDTDDNYNTNRQGVTPGYQFAGTFEQTYPNNNPTMNVGWLHPRLIQVDLQAKTVKVLMRAMREPSNYSVIGYTNHAQVHLAMPKDSLTYTYSGSNWEMTMQKSMTRAFIPTSTGHLVSLKYLCAIHKYKDVKTITKSGGLSLEASIVRDMGNKQITSTEKVINSIADNRGFINRTEIKNIHTGDNSGAFCSNTSYFRLPGSSPENYHEWQKLSNIDKIGTAYYSGNRLYMWNGSAWIYTQFS